jgi:hypothetical protein
MAGTVRIIADTVALQFLWFAADSALENRG